jgi:hypothetical protein
MDFRKKVHSSTKHPDEPLERKPAMTTTTRLAAAAVALLMSVTTVQLIASYALPQAPALQLASAPR